VTEKKTAQSVITKVGRDAVHSRPLTCIDPEVKKWKDKVTGLWSANCVYSPWWQAGAVWLVQLHFFLFIIVEQADKKFDGTC